MDYSSFTLKKLQQLSKKEGLSTKGNKQVLIDGLEKLQKPVIEVIVADLPDEVIVDDLSQEVTDPVPAVPAAPTIESPVDHAPAPIVDNVSSDVAAIVDTAEPDAAVAAFRASARTRRPRVCTMCVGCHHHPTHVAGKVTRKAAVVDAASIVDLAEKFSVVNIEPEQQPSSVGNANPAAPAKSSARTSRPRTVSTARAPLQVRSNHATGEARVSVARQAKPVKEKSTVTQKKVGSLKDLTTSAGNGKENLPSGIEVSKVTTERPGRKARSLKQVIAY